MSVRERLLQLEGRQRKGDVPSLTSCHEDDPPGLPTRPTRSGDLIESDDEEAPTLPPRRPLQAGLDVSRPISAKKRPPVPPKAKSFSSKLTTIDRVVDHGRSHTIKLVALDEEQPLSEVEPIPLPSVPEPEKYERGRLVVVPEDRYLNTEHSPNVRTPSPLQGFSDQFAKLRVGAPKAFRTVSEGAQGAFRTVQTGAPKAFQGIAAGAQKTIGNIQNDAPKSFKTAADSVSKVFADVNAGVKRTVNGIPVPRAFAQTGEDLADCTKLSLGRSGICSRCAALPLDACFTKGEESTEAYRSWSAPFSRVALHAPWCQMCKLLLAMLCRDEHDPLQLPEVRDNIQQDWLRGVPLRTWVEEGYIHQENNWPFGRSEHRYEGATQVLGPIGDVLWRAAYVGSRVGLKVLVRSAAGGGARLDPKDFQRSQRQRYRDGYEQGKQAGNQYPISCVIMITVSTATSDAPGLLWVDLVGCSNKAGAEEQVLSHFMLRAVRDGFSVTFEPQKPLSYGQVLNSRWIDMSIGKLWLAECETRHGKACAEHGWEAAAEKPAFLRLIDVDNLNIVVSDRPYSARYVALSYVWGGANMLKMRTHNVEALAKHRGLERYLSDLPRTVVDAMEVVKAVGERYIWTDALCILQEDTAESHEQIANMDRVYGSALFTIVAAEGENAQAGLPGVQRKHLTKAAIHPAERKTTQMLASMKDGTDVIAPSPASQDPATLEWIWNRRAWTFQERTLSRRLLVFAENEVVWHCRSMIAREDMPVHQSGYQQRELDWLALKPQHLGIGVDSHWKDGSFEQTRHGFTHIVRSGTFAEYAKTIAQYTAREMSFDSDAVNALAGLLRIFSLCFESECIYGLPSILLDLALLWQPVSTLERRSSELPFPSWSWAGWKGQVRYASLIRMKRDETGQFIESEGIRPMLRYFVFDKYTGLLQPLNGTARGIPLSDTELPAEWEAHPSRDGCRSATHACRAPDLFDLDPRVIPELSSRHLIFWTSMSNQFRVVKTQSANPASPKQGAITDSAGVHVGVAILDSGHADTAHHCKCLLLAEAHSSLLLADTKDDAYSCYLVMLVRTDVHTGIASRIGLGRVSKAAWVAAMPDLRLVCLG